MSEPRPTPIAPVDLADPALYINRELSLLEFERRVLAQARDPAMPLLERLRFLTICSTNLDEFFEIRVAGLRQQDALGVSKPGPDGLALHRRIAAGAGRFLRPGGHLLAEIGFGQEPAARVLYAGAGLAVEAVHPDLAGIARVMQARSLCTRAA